MRSRELTIFDETKSLKEWSEDPRCMVTYSVFKNRISYKWGFEEAIMTPVGSRPRFYRSHIIKAFGEKKTIPEWVNDERCLIDEKLLRVRLALGWKPERAITLDKGDIYRGELVEAFGEEKTRQQWIEDSRCKVKYFVLTKRLKSGWSPETAISKPNFYGSKRTREITAWEETKTITAWVRDSRCLVSRNTVVNRIAEGLSPEQAMTLQQQSGIPLIDER